LVLISIPVSISMMNILIIQTHDTKEIYDVNYDRFEAARWSSLFKKMPKIGNQQNMPNWCTRRVRKLQGLNIIMHLQLITSMKKRDFVVIKICCSVHAQRMIEELISHCTRIRIWLATSSPNLPPINTPLRFTPKTVRCPRHAQVRSFRTSQYQTTIGPTNDGWPQSRSLQSKPCRAIISIIAVDL
jgi:hypothetical protein